jgi:hypothetical protein
MKIILLDSKQIKNSIFLVLMILSGLGVFFRSFMVNDAKATEDNSTLMVLNTQHIIPLKVANS